MTNIFDRIKSNFSGKPSLNENKDVDTIIAGGYPLFKVWLLHQEPTKDIDIFTTHEPHEVLKAFGITPDPQKSTPLIATGEGIDVIQMKPKRGRPFVDTVLSSFDIGIIQIGWNPDKNEYFATDLWLENAKSGVIELDPNVDPYKNPVRTQNRLAKLHRKLGWNLGDGAKEFLKERSEAGFKLEMPEKGQVFYVPKKLRQVFWTDNPFEFTEQIKPTQGKGHILEEVYDSQVHEEVLIPEIIQP